MGRLIDVYKLIDLIDKEITMEDSLYNDGLCRALQILGEQQIVNAIPYEFIKEQIAKTSDINDEDELDFFYAGHLGYLLKIWEEENEKDI